MKILTAQQMREIDRLTVERFGISYAILMETAGSRVVEEVLSLKQEVGYTSYTVFCGKGNNGGDGAVIARLLWMRGAANVNVFLLGRVEDTAGEARVNFEILRRLAAEQVRSSGWPLNFMEITREEGLDQALLADTVIVDAIFGTGLTRPAQGLSARAIEFINEQKKFMSDSLTIVSVDLPSGLPSDGGQPIGPFVQADLTVSLTAPKIGNVISPSSDANGRLVVASIGSPDELLRETESPLHLVDEGGPSEWLRTSRRPASAHKNAVGDVLLIAGSRGKSGAAALASEAILRAGAGLATVATAASAQSLLVTRVIKEVMTEPLAETESGAIAEAALVRALELAEKRNVIAIGPGLSSSEESTRAFVRAFVEGRRAPLVIDADGLNALAPWPEELKGAESLPIVITPHPGEMARLTGKTNAEVVADGLNIAREFALRNHVITVLKGSRSLIASPVGEVYVNPTGNAGMATAGSGDVLTGLLAGLLAQRSEDPLGATITAVYLHGLAGDLAAAKLGMRSLLASDLIAYLADAILQVGGDGERGPAQRIARI
jgi:NAD(P)H-hydrate epimerase